MVLKGVKRESKAESTVGSECGVLLDSCRDCTFVHVGCIDRPATCKKRDIVDFSESEELLV
ncbi:hypothetical protein E2C01_040865 [Portunus trituberculatus]|uniref:Uncharacterized protein n=1 Tax=Portunus trituberculatus TaxID=210409 RepID=A0A5B7FHR3_PORTR|nr:hypothetical protein [Portunus trituberculatus]